MLVQDLHSLEHHVAPLMSLVGIGFALHENVEETRTPRFQADDRIRHAMIRVSRFFVLHVRVGNDQRRQALNDRRVLNHRRHRNMRHLQGLDPGHPLHSLEHCFQRRHIGFEVR